MKKRVVAILMATVVAVGSLAGCGSKGGNGGEASTEEGKVINIYSWNDEFRERLEAVYPEVESTSKDGTVTTLKDGTEIHWIINPNQDGVYQQCLLQHLYICIHSLSLTGRYLLYHLYQHLPVS